MFLPSFLAVVCGSFCQIVIIEFLRQFQQKLRKFQPIRLGGPETHYIKAKTPSMGGLAMVFPLIYFFFRLPSSPEKTVLLILVIFFAIVGIIDDLIKILGQNTKGMAGSVKLVLEVIVASGCMLYLYNYSSYYSTVITLSPFCWKLQLSLWAPVFHTILLVGSANAANITDGLDGLLAISTLIISFTFTIIAAFTSGENWNPDLFWVLPLFFVFTSIFFSYNRHPAKIFIGDVGSLLIGVFMGYMAILLTSELLYAIAALLWVLELASTTLQVVYYKITGGKRLWRMTPYHHHLEKSGWSEERIVLILNIFTTCCCCLTLFLWQWKRNCFHIPK
jgi:phospho-N-acetylmuramoyl-pentapeptide-transferase